MANHVQQNLPSKHYAVTSPHESVMPLGLHRACTLNLTTYNGFDMITPELYVQKYWRTPAKTCVTVEEVLFYIKNQYVLIFRKIHTGILTFILLSGVTLLF